MPRRKCRTYTDQQRAEAVKIWQQSGKMIAEAARDLDLTATSLREWGEARGDRRFTPTEVFPFFPFPFPWLGGSSALDVPEAVERRLTGPVARRLVDLRDAILSHPERHGLTRARVRGPTDLYNLVDDPKCEVAAIQRLRAAYHALELAVLTEYGWQDLHGPWTFARPWLDGTWRHVPLAATRRVYLERHAALNRASTQ